MITLTYKELVESIPVLSVLAQTPMPVFAGAVIRRTLDRALKEMTTFEKERLALVEEACDHDEDGKPVVTTVKIEGKDTNDYRISDPEKKAALEEKYAELLLVPVEIKGTKLKVESFGDIKIPPTFLLPWLVDTDG